MRILRNLQLTDGDTLHLYWRCTDSDNQYLLSSFQSKDFFLTLLALNKERFGIKLHDYALMDNHEHILVSIRTVKELSRFLQCVNTAFAKHINKVRGRSGAVVKDRVKAAVFEPGDNKAILACQAYFHLNRWTRTKKVLPEDYQHCGYSFYGKGQQNALLEATAAWLELGETDEKRQAAFKLIVQEKFEEKKAKLAEGKGQHGKIPVRYLGSNAFVEEKTKQLYEALRAHAAKLKQKRLGQDNQAQPTAGSDREKN